MWGGETEKLAGRSPLIFLFFIQFFLIKLIFFFGGETEKVVCRSSQCQILFWQILFFIFVVGETEKLESSSSLRRVAGFHFYFLFFIFYLYGGDRGACRGPRRCAARQSCPVCCADIAPFFFCIRQQTSAYVSIRQHTSAYVSINTSAYVSILCGYSIFLFCVVGGWMCP